MTSDANGSKPRFDACGALIGLTIAAEDAFLTFRSLVRRGILDFATRPGFSPPIRPRFTSFRAKAIRPGFDADLILMDAELELTDVIAHGRLLMRGRQAPGPRHLRPDGRLICAA